MKGRVLVIDWARDPARIVGAALLVDGRVEDLLLAGREGAAPVTGARFRGTVGRPAKGAGGAFVELDGGGTGYLRSAGETRQGQRLAVQVIAAAEPGKAPPVTTEIVSKTRRFLLTIGKPGVNVSRAIHPDAEKDRLKAFADRWVAEHMLPGNRYALPEPADAHGLVVRTAAAGAPEHELARELGELLHGWKRFAGPGLPPGGGMAECPGAVLWHALHEWTAPLPDLYIENNPVPTLKMGADGLPQDGAHEEIAMADADFWERHRHVAEPDLFAQHGVWDEIERLRSPRVDLPDGAWMAIEPTRAMVTVDVNTGETFEAAAALKANLAAAKELPRQLRLRGLGGQVAVDFAPLKKMDRRRIEEALKGAFRRDPVETTLAGWTPLGNFEIQRKRERRPLAEVLGA